MSVSLDKLRMLRRDAGQPLRPAVAVTATAPAAAAAPQPTPAPAPAPGAGAGAGAGAVPLAGSEAAVAPLSGALRNPLPLARTPSQSIEALRRLLGVRNKVVVPLHARAPVDRALPGEEIAPGLRLLVAHVPLPAPPAGIALSFARRDDSVDPRDLLFFDTETTGLAGGTGTRAFMVGAADWHHDPVAGDGLRIRQLLITTMAAEQAMLEAFAGWVSPRTVLSSYNGRCYDTPLLKTRYRLARMADPLAGLDHVDLLFPTRRRYRGVWENCRLATVERELLGILREDDLPGAQAPAAWLGFLRGGASTNLRRVAAHNHQDVVTLAQLLLRLVALDAQDREAGDAVPAHNADDEDALHAASD